MEYIAFNNLSDFSNYFFVKVTVDDVVKLSDFGVSKVDNDPDTDLHTCYTAPEVMEVGHVNTSADIYSLAIISWELWYGRLALDYFITKHSTNYQTAVRTGSRPMFDLGNDPMLPWIQMVNKCWAPEPSNRPTVGMCRKFFQDAADGIL